MSVTVLSRAKRPALLLVVDAQPSLKAWITDNTSEPTTKEVLEFYAD